MRIKLSLSLSQLSIALMLLVFILLTIGQFAKSLWFIKINKAKSKQNYIFRYSFVYCFRIAPKMSLPAASGRGICVCRFGFSRTGTAEAEPTIELHPKGTLSLRSGAQQAAGNYTQRD